MIKQEQMDNAINESYDVLALIQTAVRALGDVELRLTPPHNQHLSDIQRVLIMSYKKAEIAHEALEHVDLEGFEFDKVKCHG